MNRMYWFAAAPALLLAACNDKNTIEAKNASPEEVQKKLAQSDARPQPGRWQQTVKIEAFDMPNMPPEGKAAMAEQMGKTHTAFTCMTPEQVAKPDASFFQKTAKGCKYDHFTMSGGRIDAKMTCAEGPQKQVSTLNGTYSATQYDMVINVDTEMAPGMPVKSRLALKMNRVGECTGKDES
jgi:hypothetical protein